MLRTLITLGALVGSGLHLAAQQPSSIAKALDLHALVRPAVHADTSIQALQPPTVAYVWFRATPDGHILASGRDTSRVSLLRHAASIGRVKVQGFAPAGVLAPAKVVYAWIEAPADP
jgi:hypothetical protein